METKQSVQKSEVTPALKAILKAIPDTKVDLTLKPEIVVKVTTLEFAFPLRSNVNIKGHNIKGRINAYMVDSNGNIKYEVEWKGAERIRHNYFYKADLEIVNNKK